MEQFFGLLTTVLIMGCMYFGISKYAEAYINSTHFICPYCRVCFKLSKIEFIFALKTGVPDERIVTCPLCGRRDKMPIVKD